MDMSEGSSNCRSHRGEHPARVPRTEFWCAQLVRRIEADRRNPGDDGDGGDVAGDDGDGGDVAGDDGDGGDVAGDDSGGGDDVDSGGDDGDGGGLPANSRVERFGDQLSGHDRNIDHQTRQDKTRQNAGRQKYNHDLLCGSYRTAGMFVRISPELVYRYYSYCPGVEVMDEIR
ncbi:hypothetical protein RRG08_063407 [Elysia crispata]|uniref:Uncharacterized protein n=1 Tax=Elysia crispata TaxID=231223 RepID=A0AAE1AA21_9GAST|nr:hypothetical protein RRG08_063407 [Elysia crispata]